jgi:allantoinase
MRTLISGGVVVTPVEASALNILIENGKIAGLLEPGVSPEVDQTIDASGHVVFPGGVDGHTHFAPFDPEHDHPIELDNEGFFLGGCGAAAGGVTTIIEMPQGYPATNSATVLERKRTLGAEEAVVDFAMWGGVRPGDWTQEITDMLAVGAVGFKAYTCDEDPDLPLLSDWELIRALETLKDTGTMLGIHTENEGLLREYIAQTKATGRTDPLTHTLARPAILEEIDVNRAIYLAEQTGGWVHIVHMSSVESAEMVWRAKARGVRVTCETCPQYLALDTEDLEKMGAFAKCVPALRTRDNVENLWDYLADGTIDCITTDHCGWTTESKQQDFWEAPNGLSGIQTFLPVVISEARSRGFPWEDIARWTSGAPAELWNLTPQKGSIQVGADADLVFVEENIHWEVTTDDLLHSQKWTPFEGKTLNARVRKTILRGVPIFDDHVSERILVEKGFGQFIPANR